MYKYLTSKTYRAVTFLCLAVFSLDTIAFKQENDRNTEINYYEDESQILFRLKAYGIKVSSKQTSLPTPSGKNPVQIGKLLEYGFGAEGSASVFFTDNIATEFSLGLNVMRVKSSIISDIANNYNGNVNGVYRKKRNLYMLPATLIAQYYVAPFGAIRPYLGVGYHGVYNFTRLKEFKISNGHGAVFQLGTDFIANDDTAISLEVKQFLLTNKITYQSSVIGNKNVSSKIKINPLLISLGIGFAL
ncbi:MAG: OmpW family protein [Rickettsiaceae bacterium]|nr:MAG: OmpW family protein [Rickettsiaceae bacterium]